MRHHEIWDIMRQDDTLRNVMDAMGLYEKAGDMRHNETIGDIMRYYETAETIGDLMRQN